MAAITWKNLATPTFGGLAGLGAVGLEGVQGAADSITGGLDRISADRINTFDKTLGRNRDALLAQIQATEGKEGLAKLMGSQAFSKQGLTDTYGKHAPDRLKLLKAGTARERGIENEFTKRTAYDNAQRTAADSEGVAKHYSALANAQTPQELAQARKNIEDNIYGLSSESLTDISRRSNTREAAITAESNAATDFRNRQKTFADAQADRNSRLNAGTLTSDAFATREQAIATQREQLAANAEKHDIIEGYDTLGNAIYASKPTREEFEAQYRNDPVNQAKNLPANEMQTAMNAAYDAEEQKHNTALEASLRDRLNTVAPIASNKQFEANLRKRMAEEGVQAADMDAAVGRAKTQLASVQGITVPALERQNTAIHKATANHDSVVATAQRERDKLIEANPVKRPVTEEEKALPYAEGIKRIKDLAPKKTWTGLFGEGGQQLVDTLQELETDGITIDGENYDIPGWALTRAVGRIVTRGEDHALFRFDANIKPEKLKAAIKAEVRRAQIDIKAQAIQDAAETSFLETSARATAKLHSATQNAKKKAQADSGSIYGNASEINAVDIITGLGK